MQINFTPHKIKAAKAYIKNLVDDELKANKLERKESKDSFFRKILNLFTHSFNISSKS
jgi:hypothetical protein